MEHYNEKSISLAIQLIAKKASEDCIADEIDSGESSVDDYAGGNVDDAYCIGMETGEVLFAKDLLAILNQD